jgi:hypothetical protein
MLIVNWIDLELCRESMITSRSAAHPSHETLGARGDVLTQYIASTLLVLGR